jgi:hypothetical protein
VSQITSPQNFRIRGDWLGNRKLGACRQLLIGDDPDSKGVTIRCGESKSGRYRHLVTGALTYVKSGTGS